MSAPIHALGGEKIGGKPINGETIGEEPIGVQPFSADPPSSHRRELGVALLLFAIWSNTFIAVSYLLGSEQAAARFDWRSLTVARYVPAGVLVALYAFVLRRRESLTAIRRHWRRLTLCGLLAVPCYNFALFYGQQHGVPPPVASLTTVLAPLFILLLARLFLGEALTPRRVAGFLVSFAGIVLISLAKPSGDGAGYPLVVAITALAPLSWSIYSVLSKPVADEVSPAVWTCLAIAFGSAPLLLLLPFIGGPELVALDGAGWAALLYLSLLGTVTGFGLWHWLLRRLPASTVGLTVFLNPPLTTLSKLVLALAVPATFGFALTFQEGLGGAVVLAGLALALVRRRRRPPAGLPIEPGPA